MKLQNNEKLLCVILLFAAAILLYFGWRLFWFLTDDAYISFRYVSNSILGHGYVWNPPPFRPVEGYSNFLWIVLLDIIWRISDISPPESSNYLSLIFSFLTLVVGLIMMLRINWNRKIRKYRILFVALLLVGVITNRTFLAWTSSGLETAMFTFFTTLWVCCCIFISPLSTLWIFTIAATSTLIYLTRPDGLLFAATTLLMLLLAFLKGKRTFGIRHLIATSPLLLIVVHLVWRVNFYGVWLPNTYYAKHTGIWPESGVRYALSFILEYALWFWLALLSFVSLLKLPVILKMFSGARRIGGWIPAKHGKSSERKSDPLIISITCSTLIIHALYYTFIVGGDHFEYRVYSHLILLIFVSFVWLLNTADFKAITSILLLVAFILFSYPIPWTHWWLSHRLETRDETFCMRIAVSEHWPSPVRWYAKIFDDTQFWLIEHFVCMRHQEHKICHLWQTSRFPSRAEGMSLPSDNYPVSVQYGVGIPAWVLPKINIIDFWGLNDYVIARNPYRQEQIRRMAHFRGPPEGYVGCFTPNVRLVAPKKIVILKRRRPLTAEDIVECEKEWAEKVKRPRDAFMVSFENK